MYLHQRSTFANSCSKIIHRKSKLRKIEYIFHGHSEYNLTYCGRIWWLGKCFTTEKTWWRCNACRTCIQYWHQDEEHTWDGKLLLLSFDKWLIHDQVLIHKKDPLHYRFWCGWKPGSHALFYLSVKVSTSLFRGLHLLYISYMEAS